MAIYLSSYIISSAMIVIIVFSPFVFKIFFNNNNFIGFGFGLLCFFITSVIVSIIIIIFLCILYYGFGKKININKNENEVSIGDYLHQTTIISIIIIIMVFLIELIFFVILYIFTKRIVNLKYINHSTLTFISGYIFLFIILYLFLIIFSLFPENYEEKYTLISTMKHKIILIMDLIITSFILKLIGTIFMLFLHLKEVINKIIFVCIGIYLMPIIFFFFGFLFHKDYLIFYPIQSINFIYFLIGTISYCLFYKPMKMDEQEISMPQTPILEDN